MYFSYPDYPLGRVSGDYVGYKRSALLTVSVRVQHIDGPQMTTDHRFIDGVSRLTISADVWNRPRTDILVGGQARDALDNMVSYAPGWDAEKVTRLGQIWNEWHLNDLNPGCIHQPDESRRVCEAGYKWGTAWLVREIPDEVVRELHDMMALDTHDGNR